jgi:hypothetical protein
MKTIIAILAFSIGILAAGGDTLKYTTQVQNLADGDTFYADIHYHSPFDSIQRIMNGRLGNVNISTTANILPTKLDTTKSILGFVNARFDSTIAADSISARAFSGAVSSTTGTFSGTVSADSVFSTRGIRSTRFAGTADSSTGALRSASCTGNAATANSATTAGTVTTAAQPNITSVGTLTSLTSSGTISGDSIYTTKGVNAGNGVSGLWLKMGSGAHVLASINSSVAGGLSDTVMSQYSFIGGGQGNRIMNASDGTTQNRHGFIGGGFSNRIYSANPNYSANTISGGYQNLIDSAMAYGAIGGGYSNEIHNGASGTNGCVIAGGYDNMISGSASYSAILGGSQNSIDSINNVTVCGGGTNKGKGQYSFIGGGQKNLTIGTNSAVIAGESDTASGNTSLAHGASCVAGGEYAVSMGLNQKVRGIRTFAFGHSAGATEIPDSNAFVVNTQRFVMPRVSSTTRTGLSSFPGQMVFDTDSAKVFVNTTGTTWQALW